MILMIDNYDSFTYNIVHYFRELGSEVEVYRNDQISLADIEHKQPEKIIISPGPCTPNKAGISLAILEHFSGKLPILGVCLGHQCIGQYFGGEIAQAQQIMHGKTSLIYHNNTDIFQGLTNPFRATRYHSLVIKPSSLPNTLTTTAWTQTEGGQLEEIMGVKHNAYPIYGVQFHPESILTEHGHQLFSNFLKL